MNWLNKLERKLGRFAIPNLVIWLIGAYSIGFVINMVSPSILNYLNFQPYYILHGQIWRIITWIFQPTDTNIIFLLIMMLFYYQLGTVLERTWGTFRFNVYIIGGILVTVVGSLLIYGVTYLFGGAAVAYTVSGLMGGFVSTTYINMSIFLAFAAMYPDMQVMLYFIIPIRMKSTEDSSLRHRCVSRAPVPESPSTNAPCADAPRRMTRRWSFVSARNVRATTSTVRTICLHISIFAEARKYVNSQKEKESSSLGKGSCFLFG